ncbi:hypothetical protein ACHAXR_011953 [Thalassiosira sp. AJA248-18]
MADDEFDDEFDDDIDWSSIKLPAAPTVTPSNKRPRLDDESSLVHNLELAPTFGDVVFEDPPQEDDDDGEVVADSLQLKAIELAKDGKNLFLTGEAGCGKSWATKRIVKCFNGNDKTIFVTAPTGIAAINIGGMTIHHWGRFQLGQYYEDFDSMMSTHTMKKIQSMDALLIDEISMLDGHLFDVLECMISIIRNYDDLKDKLKQIKQMPGSGNSIMNQTMLELRWDTISECGMGDIPPFGGLQLIVVGDFYQLSPVPAGYDALMENDNLKEAGYDLKIGRQGSYAFESHAWQHSSFHTVVLTEAHRQAEQDGLFQFLNDMRKGESDLVTKHEKTLHSLQSPLPKRDDGIIPTELHSKNYVVDRKNREELHKLPSDLFESASLDEVELHDEYKQKILSSNGLQHLIPKSATMSTLELIDSRSLPRNVENQIRHDLKTLSQYAQENFFEKDCRAAHNIELKEDAQVMLLWNLEFKAKLANGSRGVVKGFFPAKGYYYLVDKEIRKRDEERGQSDEDDASFEEAKELAISDDKGGNLAVITPSKMSQETDRQKRKQDGSQETDRQKKKQKGGFDFAGVIPEFVKEITAHVANMGPVVIERELQEMKKVLLSEIVELPYIYFANGKRRIIRPQPFSKEFKGVGTATRWQIPLTLAWAISIHKSQGMTIEWLHINLTDCFAIGQAYVACSRGKCLNTMTVKHFKPSEIKTSEQVKKFYHAVNNGRPYTGGTWSDTIEQFDKDAKKEIEKKKVMRQHYNNSVPCSKCGTMCVVSQIKTNRTNNQGKFFISCPSANGAHGHTWELVNTLPLKKTEAAHNNDNGSQPFKLLTPGVDGAIAGRLEESRFVLTGVFPELGGGFGMKLGKDNMKAMVESFGGKVTGSISGKTNFVIVGDEPGPKKLEEAKSKGVPTIDRSTLRKILMGEAELPASSAKDNPQPKLKFEV